MLNTAASQSPPTIRNCRICVWFWCVWPNTAHWSLSKPYMHCFERNAALVELTGSIVGNIPRLGLFRLTNNRHWSMSVPTCKSDFIFLRWANSIGTFVVKNVSSRKQMNPYCSYTKMFCKRTIYNCHYAICGCHSNQLLRVNAIHDRTSCLLILCVVTILRVMEVFDSRMIVTCNIL
jgi:hypothetical protein